MPTANPSPTHRPVLLEETLGLLRPVPGGRYVDGTAGSGGHAAAILEASSPDGHLLAIDRDPEAVERCRRRLAEFGDRVTVRQANYSELGEVLRDVGWDTVDGILVDLGVSSNQLDEAARGFSFSKSGPLDVRMDPGRGRPARLWLEAVEEDELARVLREYGEERRSRAVARAILRALGEGRLDDTAALAEVVSAVVGRPGQARHPATRTFQAIRIAVNGELEHLEAFLAEAWTWLAPGGRLVILAYHSLEDRLVKGAFRKWEHSCLCPRDIPVCRCGWSQKARLLNRRPIRPSAAEVDRNPRARSARLRAVERVAA